MSGRAGGSNGNRTLDAASFAGSLLLILLGLGAMALGAYFWSFEVARPPSPERSGGLSFAGLGYALAIVLFLLATPPVAIGLRIVRRPTPIRLALGAAIGGVYGAVTLVLALNALGYLRGRPLDPETATLFAVAALFLVAAALLVTALVAPEPAPPSNGRVARGARPRDRWQIDARLQRPPPGYGPRRR